MRPIEVRPLSPLAFCRLYYLVSSCDCNSAIHCSVAAAESSLERFGIVASAGAAPLEAPRALCLTRVVDGAAQHGEPSHQRPLQQEVAIDHPPVRRRIFIQRLAAGRLPQTPLSNWRLSRETRCTHTAGRLAACILLLQGAGAGKQAAE